MKIGIMGGTFDPIHSGHLMLGRFARDLFALDEIWFMPNGTPPHKANDNIELRTKHRDSMLPNYPPSICSLRRRRCQVFSHYRNQRLV